MTASKINPNQWDGEERDGGYIAKNNKPASANSPDYKGRIYLVGVGWYWISGWIKGARGGEILALRLQEMTDEQATKFCKPKPQSRGNSAPRSSRPPNQNGADTSEPEIPF